MHQQLSLWPQEKSQQPDIWQNLTSNSKNELIAALARFGRCQERCRIFAF